MNVVSAISDLRRFVKGPNIAPGPHRASVIAVAAQKGGVGKATTAVHLAAGLARFHNRKTLLIDLDAQGHVGMSLRAISGPAHGDTLSDILLQKRRDIQEIVRPTTTPDLWIVPSDPDLNVTEQLMGTKIGKEMLLKQTLRIARTHFDVIVLDCPPNLGSLTVNALVAADNVLVPCDLSLLSLDGVEAIVDTIATVQETLNPTLDLLGLLRTRVDRRNQTVNQAIEKTLNERYGDWVFGHDICVATDIAKAQLVGTTIYEYNQASRGAKAYQGFSDEVAQRLAS